MTLIDVYNIAVNLAAAAGLLYLLYSGRYAVWYRRFYMVIALGLLVAVVGGPLPIAIDQSIRHFVHGLATLLIAIGLYDLLRRQITTEVDWERLMLDDR